MKLLVLMVIVAALQQTHDPQPCNRVGTQGRVACKCHRVGTPDGEGCSPNVEDRACMAWCRPSLCECPVTCEL